MNKEMEIKIIRDAFQKRKSFFDIQKILKNNGIEMNDAELLESMTLAYKDLGQTFAYDEATFIIQNYADLDDLYEQNYKEKKFAECRLIVGDRLKLFNQFRILRIE